MKEGNVVEEEKGVQVVKEINEFHWVKSLQRVAEGHLNLNLSEEKEGAEYKMLKAKMLSFSEEGKGC